MLAAAETINSLGLNGTLEGGETSFCLGWDTISSEFGLGFEGIGVSGFSSSSFVAIDESRVRSKIGNENGGDFEALTALYQWYTRLVAVALIFVFNNQL